MSACYLPDEILHDIFRRLIGTTVIKCRAVCRRWRDAVDSLSDRDWKKICCNQRFAKDDYESLRKKYGLSWRDIHRASEGWSWSVIESAEIGIEELCDNVNYIKVLPNNVLACLQSNKFKHYYGYSDTIIYYDLDTSKEISREEIQFPFLSRQYDENEHLIVLIKDNGDLFVIVKENKKQFYIGNLEKRGGFFELCVEEYFSEYTLIEKEVFFKNSEDNKLMASKLIYENEEVIVSTDKLKIDDLETFTEDVIQFTYKNNVLHILTSDGNIYSLENSSLNKLVRVTFYDIQNFLKLHIYGFDWRSRAVYFWVTSRTNNSPINFNPYINAFYGHGDLILGSKTFSSKVYIHWNPFFTESLEDVFETFQQKPNRVIDFTILLNVKNTSFRPIQQLDIVENGTNMKITVLGLKRLFILEFNPTRRFPMKLRSRIVHRPILKTRVHKKKLITKPKKKSKKEIVAAIESSHPYATRSKAHHSVFGKNIKY